MVMAIAEIWLWYAKLIAFRRQPRERRAPQAVMARMSGPRREAEVDKASAGSTLTKH